MLGEAYHLSYLLPLPYAFPQGLHPHRASRRHRHPCHPGRGRGPRFESRRAFEAIEGRKQAFRHADPEFLPRPLQYGPVGEPEFLPRLLERPLRLRPRSHGHLLPGRPMPGPGPSQSPFRLDLPMRSKLHAPCHERHGMASRGPEGDQRRYPRGIPARGSDEHHLHRPILCLFHRRDEI